MDLQELKIRQSWPLQKKIDHSLYTIETYLARTEGMAYVAFSGGKDSTVLLDLVRIIDKSVPAVFVNTGNEYPDIIKFVRHLRDDKGYNIIELRPKMTPRQVWEKYGFPLVSKAQAEYIDRFKKNPEYAVRQQAKAAERGWSFGKVSDRWKFLVSEPYGVSNECCSILKKAPSKKYALETGRHPIIGTMASESDLRRTEYINRGGVIHLGKSCAMDSVPRLWRYGWRKIYGHTLKCVTLKYVMSIIADAKERDVWVVDLDAMRKRIGVSISYTPSIRSIIK